MTWIKITDQIPANGQEVLVWTGYEYIVADAEVFDPATAWYSDSSFKISDAEREQYKENDLTLKGTFRFFGTRVYFNNEKIYWMELPPVPKKEEASEE